jgi:hypothetical protein
VYAKGPGLGKLDAWLGDRKIADRVDGAADALAPALQAPPVRMILQRRSIPVKFRVKTLPLAAPKAASGIVSPFIEADTLGDGTVRTRRLAALVAGVLLEPTEPTIEQWLVVGPFDDWGCTELDTAFAPEIEHEAGGVRRDGPTVRSAGKRCAGPWRRPILSASWTSAGRSDRGRTGSPTASHGCTARAPGPPSSPSEATTAPRSD